MIRRVLALAAALAALTPAFAADPQLKFGRFGTVQVIAPAGDRGFTMHAIERSIDGVPVADGTPLHFTRAP